MAKVLLYHYLTFVFILSLRHLANHFCAHHNAILVDDFNASSCLCLHIPLWTFIRNGPTSSLVELGHSFGARLQKLLRI